MLRGWFGATTADFVQFTEGLGLLPLGQKVCKWCRALDSFVGTLPTSLSKKKVTSKKTEAYSENYILLN